MPTVRQSFRRLIDDFGEAWATLRPKMAAVPPLVWLALSLLCAWGAARSIAWLADPPVMPFVRPGFATEMFKQHWRESFDREQADARRGAIVMTPIALLLATVAKASHAERRRAHRRAAGLCPACGYDLRATPGRCPECGRTPTPAT